MINVTAQTLVVRWQGELPEFNHFSISSFGRMAPGLANKSIEEIADSVMIDFLLHVLAVLEMSFLLWLVGRKKTP